MSETYTVDYFLEQTAEFIALCGERSFWEAPQKVRDNAVRALGWVFLRCPDADLAMFLAAIENYTRRDCYVQLSLGRSEQGAVS